MLERKVSLLTALLSGAVMLVLGILLAALMLRHLPPSRPLPPVDTVAAAPLTAAYRPEPTPPERVSPLDKHRGKRHGHGGHRRHEEDEEEGGD